MFNKATFWEILVHDVINLLYQFMVLKSDFKVVFKKLVKAIYWLKHQTSKNAIKKKMILKNFNLKWWITQ